METPIEIIILKNLINNEDYFRTCIPYIKRDYLSTTPAKEIFSFIDVYHRMQDSRISRDALKVLAERSKLDAQNYELMINLLKEVVQPDKDTKLQWLVTETEKYCRDSEIYNIMIEVADQLNNPEKDVDASMAERMQEAYGITFSIQLGHDYFGDVEARYDFISSDVETLSTGLSTVDMVLRGGWRRKTLAVLQSGSSGGFKSGSMCHFAVNGVKQGRNVVYFTFELSEERVGERIDANMLSIELNDLHKISKDEYVSRIKGKQNGRLIIKEYPTGTAHIGHLRYFLKQLQQKDGFIPDEIYFDYIGIMASSRAGKNANTYEKGKLVAEEVRSLLMELDCAGVTAVQSNRTGKDNLDMDETSVSESYGIIYTADVIFGLIENDEHKAANIILWKQIKNRFNDTNINNTFPLKVNKGKMTLYDNDNFTAMMNKPDEKKDSISEISRTERFQTGTALSIEGLNL